jgi:dipeptidyl aminopeptidase/acylaminoacyl peptidase
MKRISVHFLLLCLPLFLFAQQQRPITFDDLIGMERIGDPQLSPDGSTIAFVVTKFDKEANGSNSNLYLVPVDGGPVRQLTTATGANHSPRWLPDGSEIALISTREGTPQIYTISLHGGEAHKVSDISTGVNGLLVSPDGTTFAYWTEGFPECMTDDCNRQRFEEKSNRKTQAMIFDRLLYRHWDSWKHETRYQLYSLRTGEDVPRLLTPGDYDTPPISLGGYWTYAFSPDGREMVFLRNTDPMVAISTNNDVFIVPSSGGDITRITTNPANDFQPAFSPDGKYISYLMMERPGFEADRHQLVIHDRATDVKTNLTADLDYSVNEYVWSPDSRYIYFNADDKGNTSVFRLSVDDRAIEKIFDAGYNSSLRITPDGRTLVFLHQRMNKPAELYRMNTDGSDLKKITGLNDERVAELDMNPAEHFWFTGAEETQVHGMLLKPPGFDGSRKYPLVYLAHGGPQGQWGDQFHYRWNAQMFASRGYVVAMVNRRGSTGYGQDFTDQISGDWGGKAYIDLMNGLDFLIDAYDFIDADNIGGAGASYGGYMINWIATQTDRFKCLVSHAGLFNVFSMYGTTEELWFPEWEFGGTPYTNPELYEKWSPLGYADKITTPTLVVHGYYDFRVDVSEGFQMFTALQRQGVESKMLYFPDEGHWINKPLNAELWYTTVLDWLDAYLKE